MSARVVALLLVLTGTGCTAQAAATRPTTAAARPSSQVTESATPSSSGKPSGNGPSALAGPVRPTASRPSAYAGSGEPTGDRPSAYAGSGASPAPLAPAAPAGLPSPTGRVLVQVAKHEGSVGLPDFTPRSSILYVTFSCVGPGSFALGSDFDVSPCDGTSTTGTMKAQAGVPERLTVRTAPTTVWRLLIRDAT